MANYNAMTSYELLLERDRLSALMMASENVAEIEMLSDEIDLIEDILSERDPLGED